MTKLSLEERVSAGWAEATNDRISYQTVDRLAEDLRDLWEPSRSGALLSAPAGVLYARRKAPRWQIGMSSDFSKDVSKIDRKLQGRILEALIEITEDPVSPRGDTIKPLSGTFEGYWRYRLGDYRLIYSPDESRGSVTLLAFEPRGSAYVD